MKHLQPGEQQLKYDPANSELLHQLRNWWQNSEQSQLIKVLSHPTNDKSTLSILHFLISKLTKEKRVHTILYIVDSKQRQLFMLQFGRCVLEKLFKDVPASRCPYFTNSYATASSGQSQIVISTFKAYIQYDLEHDNVYDGVIVQTSNFVRTVRDGFGDYITDTYLRRGYIEALRMQECYRDYQKNQNRPLNPPKQRQQSQSANFNAQGDKQLQKKQAKFETTPIVDQSKKIRLTFYNKREHLLHKKKQKQEGPQFFEQNELVLISGLIYIIGFFYNQLQIKKNRNFSQFIEDFQNKTSLNKSYLQNVLRYFIQIFENCPNQSYDRIEDMYLYSLCQFINKIVKYSRIFPDDYEDLFEIVKPEKFAIDRRESLIEQSTSCLIINCKDNNKICGKAFKKKSPKCFIIQNFACPQQYWHYIFKRNNILLNPESNHYLKLYGVHISKSPSNEDINFAEKLSEGIETIKLKACGVLLHDLSKFIPDGIVVYFHSLEGLESFMREMEVDQEAIIKKIDHHKKIFYESVFQEQNHVNFLKFKKCCEIGRGAIFFMVANGKAAQYLKFYRHLSRCIVFFGLPRRQNQYRKQLQLPQNHPPQQKLLLQLHHINMQKISIFNECINNCVNDPQDYKSVIFVGGQITSDLETWYKSFIKSWDETTRESLTKLRCFYQKMGKAGIFG